MATSDRPVQADLDKCVHCGLCLNACPTYRELGVEMDSPRGRIYQMNAVANGAPITPEYVRHIDLCLACRGCETACPSGVPYGRIVESARAQLEPHRKRSIIARAVRSFALKRLIPSRRLLAAFGSALYMYQASGLQKLVRAAGILRNFESLTPDAEAPFFFRNIGQTYPAEGTERYRVAFLAGCIANVAFARLNEATIRVLQKNGCTVVVPEAQTCCGALHLHSGMLADAKEVARRNIEALKTDSFDAIITNAAGCGSTLKEYGQLFGDEAAEAFAGKVRDITEFLAGIELNTGMRPIDATVTYQDSCHLAHGQKIREAPRRLLKAIPGLTFRDMPMADLCCGSAGIYNVVENDMAMQILERKMKYVNTVQPQIIATANPGCLLQLRAGVLLHGQGQRVVHVVELLDEAYR